MRAFVADHLLPLLDQLRPFGRAFILGGIALSLWLGLRRTSLDSRARTATWLAVVAPLLVWYVAIWQFALANGFQARVAIGGVLAPIVPLAIFLPLLIWLPLL